MAHFQPQRQDWPGWPVFSHSTAIVDPQSLPGTGDERADLLTVLRTSLTATQPPRIRPSNPHCWMGYVERHQGKLAGWFA